jgi:NTE family protein
MAAEDKAAGERQTPSSGSLRHVLQAAVERDGFALSLAPGFFRFYALMGVLHALEEEKLLKPSHIAGASAGALVGGFLATGASISSFIGPVLSITRDDIWDPEYSLSGLLKGEKVQQKLTSLLPVHRMEDCPIPLGITAYHLAGFKTRLIRSGDLATAMRASACFPGLFQPVELDGGFHIDGGVFDWCGSMALPGTPEKSALAVNITYGLSSLSNSVIPDHLISKAQLFTIVLENIPMVSPFTMKDVGPKAYKIAKDATKLALNCPNGILELASGHQFVVIDGAKVHNV